MKRIDKCRLAVELGYTYDPETGKVYGLKGQEINRKDKKGYIKISIKKNDLLGHHFAWWCVYNEVVEELDHKDQDKTNNRILNLRSVTSSKNKQNNNCKGYYKRNDCNRWHAQITVNYKCIYLGLFETEEEAHQAYLSAKKIHHITN